jgi:ligand-binding sensor domain-containing protein
MRSEEISSTPPALVQQHVNKVAYEDPSDRRPSPDDAPVSRTDYPDASHTNRRPPFFRSGAREIHTKNDTRVFDVCGQYVCATGFFSRAWDVVSGELVMNLSHGESTKGVSIAFKPGRTLDEEGKSVWIGTNTGELLEVDISTQSVVASRSSPSRREIIKIYRHKRELWTLDDEGRLLVWPPDESGCPNFQHSYSNPYDRVARGHTFSMIVGDTLWYATGKEVRIYQPNANDSSFQVLKTPLGKNHSGDVSCGTATRDLSRVYLGHADGKLTIYSTRDYSHLGTVNVSLYKISALAVVGDYLWAGYKTGMIYVYDTTTNPWTVKKDWLAHDQGVCGLIPDPSGIWTINRFQVLSLGVDNYIRPWDGMLEDDWLGMLTRPFDLTTF